MDFRGLDTCFLQYFIRCRIEFNDHNGLFVWKSYFARNFVRFRYGHLISSTRAPKQSKENGQHQNKRTSKSDCLENRDDNKWTSANRGTQIGYTTVLIRPLAHLAYDRVTAIGSSIVANGILFKNRIFHWNSMRDSVNHEFAHSRH